MNIYEKYKSKQVEKYQELKEQIIEKCVEDSIMVVSRVDDEYEMLVNNENIIKELNQLGLSVLKIKRKLFHRYAKEYDDLNYGMVIYIEKIGVNLKSVLRKHTIIKEYKGEKI